MIQEGDKLYGRGTTDCLGHVALLTDLMAQLAETKPVLERSVVCVFIANEENGVIPNIGIDEMQRRGEIDFLKNGPMYWIDHADKHPCIGTGSVVAWSLEAFGKAGHSGMPQNCVNAILLVQSAMAHLLNKFHARFVAHPVRLSASSTLIFAERSRIQVQLQFFDEAHARILPSRLYQPNPRTSNDPR